MSLLKENAVPILACAPAALTSTSGDGLYVSTKGYRKCQILLVQANATTVTTGAVTLLQASDVAGTGAKALAFTTYWYNHDVTSSTAATLTSATATSNTFNTNTTASKNIMYLIDVAASDLDKTNSFDCLRVDITGSAGSYGAVVYTLYDPIYAGSPISAMTD